MSTQVYVGAIMRLCADYLRIKKGGAPMPDFAGVPEAEIERVFRASMLAGETTERAIRTVLALGKQPAG